MARSTLRQEGWLPFFSAISIGRMIHAPSRPTSPECFHFPPPAPSRASRRPALLSRLPSSTVSLSARRIQFLPRRMARHSRSTPRLPGVASAHRSCAMRARQPPPTTLALPLSISRALAPFLSPCQTRARQPHREWRDRINLFRPIVRIAGITAIRRQRDANAMVTPADTYLPRSDAPNSKRTAYADVNDDRFIVE